MISIVSFLMIDFAVVGLTLIILGFYGFSNLTSCPLNSVKQIFTSIISIGAVLLSIAIGFSLCKNTCGVCTTLSSNIKVYMLALICILSGSAFFAFSYLISNEINKNTDNTTCSFKFTELPLILTIMGGIQLLVGFGSVILELKSTNKIKVQPVEQVQPSSQETVRTPPPVQDSRVAAAIADEDLKSQLEVQKQYLKQKSDNISTAITNINRLLLSDKNNIPLKAHKTVAEDDLNTTLKEIQNIDNKIKSIGSNRSGS